jgi:hypothetical protein
MPRFPPANSRRARSSIALYYYRRRRDRWEKHEEPLPERQIPHLGTLKRKLAAPDNYHGQKRHRLDLRGDFDSVDASCLSLDIPLHHGATSSHDAVSDPGLNNKSVSQISADDADDIVGSYALPADPKENVGLAEDGSIGHCGFDQMGPASNNDVSSVVNVGHGTGLTTTLRFEPHPPHSHVPSSLNSDTVFEQINIDRDADDEGDSDREDDRVDNKEDEDASGGIEGTGDEVVGATGADEGETNGGDDTSDEDCSAGDEEDCGMDDREGFSMGDDDDNSVDDNDNGSSDADDDDDGMHDDDDGMHNDDDDGMHNDDDDGMHNDGSADDEDDGTADDEDDGSAVI